MVDIEPYKQIQKTNVKEHNDLVAKINEIIDVLNNTQIETVVPKITALENDVSTINATDSLQWTDIESLKDYQSAQDVTIGNLDTQVKGVTDSLVSNIAIIDGITTGNMKVRIEREKTTSIDSNDYNIQKPVSMELIQGSGPSTFKAQITLSDGTIIRSDDFMFTTEAIGTDVYISSFVFKNGNVAGTISADIGLSNGTTIEANNFVVPMDPSLLNTVQDLSTRLSAVEGGSVGGLDELKAQVQTNTTNIGTLTTEIDNLDIQKADQSNSNQEIVAGTITATNITKGGVNVATVNDIPDISGKVNISQGVGNAGKVLGIGADGNVTPTELISGEVWEPFDPNNHPTDFVEGEVIMLELKQAYILSTYPSSWSSSITPSQATVQDIGTRPIIKFALTNDEGSSKYGIPYNIQNYPYVCGINSFDPSPVSHINSGATAYLGYITIMLFNGASSSSSGWHNNNTMVSRAWRLKK